MIVSINTFYLICVIFAVLCAVPALYTRFIEKKGDERDWSYLFVILLLPLNWCTPAIFTITSCDEYTKDVLLFPTPNYSLGNHAYIVNQTDTSLYLEHIVYGVVSARRIKDNVIIEPETIYRHREVKIEYILKDAPENIQTNNNNGSVHCRLSCLP